jgi:Spy/CpxP family protein refolding chaperone
MSVRTSILFLIGLVLVLAAQARADEPKKPVPSYLYVPGYPSLSSKIVQKEIGLTEEQVNKITEISKETQAAARPYPHVDWAKLSEEERKKKQAEMSKAYEKWSQEYKKRTEEARQRIDAVLTPEQISKLEMIEVRAYSAPMLLHGGLNEKLKLTDEQKEQLSRQNDKLQKKIAELQQQQQTVQNQANRAAMEILTPEQVAELKKLRKEGFRGGYPRMGYPVVPPKK